MKKVVHYFLLITAFICIGLISQITFLENKDYYTVMYDVAIGILLSIIFYFIVDFIPQYHRKKLGFKLIQVSYSRLLSHIETLLSITKQYYSLEQELKDLTLIEWSKINNKTPNVEEFVYTVSNTKNKKCVIKNNISIPSGVRSPVTLDNIAKGCLINIEKNLNSIFLYESYFVEDTKFFMYLTQLRNSRLIDRYTSKYVYNSLAETYKNIYELQKIYLGLKKYNLHYFESNSIIDVSEEALQYHKDLKSNALIQKLIDFYKRENEIYSTTTRRIFYQDKKHSKSIADKMDEIFKLERSLFNSIKEVMTNDDLNIC